MKVAVLGANTTSRDVARVCVLAGEAVRLHESDATAVMDSIDIVERQLDDRYETGAIDEDERAGATERLEGTTGLEAAVTDADVVIDTACHELGELQAQFAALEELVDRDTVVATVASTVSVTEAATGLRHPDRAVGFQFHDSGETFVEIILAEQTGTDAASVAAQFADSVAGEWVTVRDTPGNVSMRLSLALEVAAIRMLDEGVAGVEAIDTAFRHAYDTDVGPLERADRIGLDTHRESLLSLADRLGPRFEPPPLLNVLVEERQTGAEAGEGFYRWEDGEPAESALTDPVSPSGGQRDEV